VDRRIGRVASRVDTVEAHATEARIDIDADMLVVEFAKSTRKPGFPESRGSSPIRARRFVARPVSHTCRNTQTTTRQQRQPSPTFGKAFFRRSFSPFRFRFRSSASSASRPVLRSRVSRLFGNEGNQGILAAQSRSRENSRESRFFL
jgi:hypothetical protein